MRGSIPEVSEKSDLSLKAKARLSEILRLAEEEGPHFANRGEGDKSNSFLRAKAKRSGRPLALGDALIAGTTLANGLTLVTRNVRGFEDLDIDLVNPWDAA